MKNQLICWTEHSPGCHKLIVGGAVVYSVPTEIELVRLAKEAGINFKELDHKFGCGDDKHFTTKWYGTKSQVEYLAWKGTIGPGAQLKASIQKHR